MRSFLFRWRLAIHESQRLPSRAKLVGFTLAEWMDEDGGSCFPSQKMIGKYAGIKSKSTVVAALNDLKANGYLSWVSLWRPGGKWRQNHYQACIPTWQQKLVR